ncbi:MAG: hypothetical protein AB8B60_15320 [Sulfitobacter sp.]
MDIKRYEILDAPAQVDGFSQSLAWSTKVMKYDDHPAYSPLMQNASPMLRIKALVQFVRSMVPLSIKRLIKYEMIPLELRSPKTASDFMRLAKVAGRNTFRLHPKMTKAVDSAILKKIEADGCCVVKMDDETFAKVEAITDRFFDRLKARRAATAKGEDRDFDESRSSVDSREDGTTLYDELNSILKESGVLDAVSRYLGRQVSLIDVNPQINDSSDSFWRKIFPDMPDMDLPKSAYFHRDASGGDLKAIFYMSDVGPENGPFSYVVGSNRMPVSRLDDLIGEANDHNGLSATHLEARARFAALPTKLQQKGAFGNDLKDDNALAEEIRKSVWEITAPKGSIVLFDTKGIHRGGMVVDGERHVVTTVIG